MKHPLFIVGAVVGYSLLETALLLIYLLPERSYPTGLRDPLLAIAQLLTIPGMAALFSVILYGRFQWKRRVAIHIATVPAFLLLMLLIASPLGLLERALEKRGLDPGVSDAFSIATIVCRLVMLAAVPILLFLFGIKARKHGVELESSRWLAERHRSTDPGERKWRERGLRWSLWIPSLMVLAVILFLPEMWGLLSHLQNPRAIVLPGDGVRSPGYEVTIPLTWVTRYRGADPSTKESWVFGMAGRGMAFGAARYFHRDVPLSWWTVRIGSERDSYVQRWVLSRYRPSIQRNFAIGSTTLTCQEYVPIDIKTARMKWASPAYIECSNPTGLYVTLEGEEVHVPTFYKMVGGITPALPDVK